MAALTHSRDHPLTIGLAGFGTAGRAVAASLSGGAIPELRLTAIAARDMEKARAASASLDPRPVVVPVAELPRRAEVVVECASVEAFPEIARATLTAGKTMVAVSASALAEHPELIDLARRHGGVIRIATGALPGLGIVRCAREGGIRSIKHAIRFRVASLAHANYVRTRGFDFSNPPAEPVLIFRGSARETAAAFPHHLNVVVALALAGPGLDETVTEVWADPALDGNVLQVAVDSEAVELTLESRNRPTGTSSNTSRIVAPSIIAALRSMVSPLQVGS